MICLYAETSLSNLTLIVYTCVCIPFLQIWDTAGMILTWMVDPHHQPKSRFCDDVVADLEVDVSFSRFEELGERESEEVCAVCLTEFEREDAVNRVGRCGHVFHEGCLEKWLDRCQFTCPLCRSSVLLVRPSPCNDDTWSNAPFCVNLAHNDD